MSNLALAVVLLALPPSGRPANPTTGAAPGRSSPQGVADTTVDGKFARYLEAPDGHIDGVVLEDGTVAWFGPRRRGFKTVSLRRGDALRIQGDVVRGLPGPYLVHASMQPGEPPVTAPGPWQGTGIRPDDLIVAKHPQLQQPTRLEAAANWLRRLTTAVPRGRPDSRRSRRRETGSP